MDYAAFTDELNQPMLKQALIERLVRLGATDIEDLPGVRHLIKSTPRVFMRKRSPQELHTLEQGIAGAFNRFEQPVVDKAKSLVAKTPIARSPSLEKGTNALLETMIRNPDFAAAKLSPIPGSSFAYLAGKKGLEKAIDRWAPAIPRLR